MRGSIVKVPRKNGHAWRVFIDLPSDDPNERPRLTEVFDRLQEAEEWRAEKVHEIHTGWSVNPETMSLKDYLQEWFTSHKKNIEASTQGKYRRAIDDHIIPQLGSRQLKDLSPAHIENFYDHELKNGRKDGEGGLKPSTVNDYHTVLRKALEDAVKHQLISENPAGYVNPPSPSNQEIDYFTSQEAQEFLEASKESMYHNLYHIAVMTGLRRSELLGLRWQDVSLYNQVIQVQHVLVRTSDGEMVSKSPKTKNGKRSVALDKTEVSVLKNQRNLQQLWKQEKGKQWKGNSYDLVFTSQVGTIINPSNLRRDFRNVLMGEGLPLISFNGLRHTHATLLLEQEVHPKVVKERMGHSRITVTLDRYSHAIPSMQREAVEKLSEGLFRDTEEEG